MGLLDLFGGDSSSSSQTSTNTTDNSKTLSGPSSQAGGDLVQLAPNLTAQGGISGVTLTDEGAIKDATDLVGSDLQSITGVASQITDNANKAVQSALDLADKSRQTDTQSVFGNFAAIAKWAFFATALGVGAWFAFSPSKEKKNA